ncbi:unnamed protein product [Caenorhabditis bovis]|uniref:Vacuolar-sorting protein SNF8 n=1 Tax=Caenorhabditis bovis TaxID=2654633 RepID=A0A8S1EVS8_9PELO|nr:unnamed protein product [Caenorhabditis bovis]
MATRRRIGIGAIQSRQQTASKFAAKGEQLASEQLEQFSQQLEQLSIGLENFAQRHRDEIKKNSQFRRHFQEMCASVGVDPLASGKGFWAKALGFGDFYYELGIQIVEICLSTTHINGGIMTVEEIRNRLMRTRSRTRKETISTDDILRAVEKLKVLGNGFELVPLGGGRFLVQSVPGELSMDHSRVLQLAEDAAYVTKELIMDKLRWDEPRATAVLDYLVKEGLAWIDDQSTDTTEYWFPSLFLQQYCHSSSASEMASFKVRPEHTGPPQLYYNDTEASKYASNSHITAIQHEMAERALELLALPDGKSGLILDIGCGTGMSSEVLLDNGHIFMGLDVSEAMLGIARDDEDLEAGDFILQDMGLGMPFRPGTFDGAISISAIQWLCHANSANENPRKRLYFFFQSLYGCLGRGSRAVFQFYPENDEQCELIMSQATKAGFNGGLVVDYPESTKRKKIYLVLMTGGVAQLPQALSEETEEQKHIDNAGRRFVWNSRKSEKVVKGSKAWIEQKRQRMIKQGKDVRHESKYSGRKRKPKF